MVIGWRFRERGRRGHSQEFQMFDALIFTPLVHGGAHLWRVERGGFFERGAPPPSTCTSRVGSWSSGFTLCLFIIKRPENSNGMPRG